MVEGKVNWLSLDKLDRLRRAHAHKVMTNPPNPQSTRGKIDSQCVPCKFFQTGKCPHKSDHTTSGQFYKHICSFCASLGKRFAHPLKDFRNRKDQDSKNE